MEHPEYKHPQRSQPRARKRSGGWLLWLPTTVLLLLCGFTCLSGPNAAWALAAARHARVFSERLLIEPAPIATQAAVRSVVASPPYPTRRFTSNRLVTGTKTPLRGNRAVAAVTSSSVTSPTPSVASTIRYAPRVGWAQRMVGGQFQGSEDGTNYVTFYTVAAAPPAGQWTSAAVPVDLSQYRFLRYLAPDGAYGNIAEVEFDGPDGSKLTGTGFGTAGSWDGHGNVFSNALDGSLNSFFDAPDPGNADFVGIDRGAGTSGTAPVTSTIRYAPRPGWAQRMVGGQFQGSEDGTNYITFYTVAAVPPVGQWTSVTIPVDLSQYRFLRYLAPDGAYGNIAEVEFDGPDGSKLTGTGFGTAGSWDGHGNVFSNALDGSLNSFFDAPDPGNADFVGIDRGSSATQTTGTVTAIGPVVATHIAQPDPTPAPQPVAAPAPPAPILMPLEIMGADGTTATVQVSVPSSATVTGLWLEAHNLSYPDKASVQINGGPWTPLDNSTVQVADPGKSYGGIGGAFSTLKMTLPLSSQAVQAGTNTISFRFNMTDGVSSGFRILAFNFLDTNGQPVLPSSTFVQDDPNTWQPPLPDAQDIAAGQALWHGAQLLQSDIVLSPIKATCADCHTDDGRDLKYFNYSNYSIIKRAEFHGLSETQGEQIASYIRTLNVPNPGRPWNPPYQPGPGLDEKPVQDWAAGAGVDAVLAKSSDMLPYIFPSGLGSSISANAADIAANGNLNIRELPIAMQLPDWNHWLPVVWPGDVPGGGFTSSAAFTFYPTLLQTAATDAANPMGISSGTTTNINQFSQFIGYWTGLVSSLGGTAAFDPSHPNGGTGVGGGIGPGGVPLTSQYAMDTYSLGLWRQTKLWGIMQTFGLEDKGQDLYGATAANGAAIEARQWPSEAGFHASPGFDGIYGDSHAEGANAEREWAAANPGAPAINENPLTLSPLVPGSDVVYESLDTDWYYLQFILNAGNRHGPGGGNPVDWGYFEGRINNLASVSGQADIGRFVAVMVKNMQQYDNGTPPTSNNSVGWQLRDGELGYLLMPTDPIWPGVSTSDRIAINNAYLTSWLAAAEQWTPQEYWAEASTDVAETHLRQSETTAQISGGYPGSPDPALMLYSTVPAYDQLGVDPTLVNNYVGWLQTLLPNVNWAGDR